MKLNLRGLLWPILGLAVGLVVFGVQPRAHALPEYATRTGEPCATCHVNPAGGGPRTARGALWLAAGKPDKVPDLPANTEPASAGQASGQARPESAAAGSGQALYEKLSCAGCHGAAGEGAYGPALNVPDATGQAQNAIRNGQGTMRAYDAEALSDEDLASLVGFLQTLGGKPNEAAAATPLPGPAAPTCGGAATGASTLRSCGGN